MEYIHNYNERMFFDLIKSFYDRIKTNQFVTDKTGVNCVEEIGYYLPNLNPYQPLLNFYEKKTNEKYCKKELNWYLSESLSIIGYVDDVTIWNQVCTKDKLKEVNSNYGWCVFSKENGNQFKNVIKELKKNYYSRRAYIVYIRPSMHEDCKRNGMSDFMCTIGTSIQIVDDKLQYTVHQRSCDFIFGLFNDFYWHCYVYDRLYKELKKTYKKLQIGNINFLFNSIHVYQRHFDLIERIYLNYFKTNCKIYKIKNLINGKLYVGRTSRTLEERFKQHKNRCDKGMHDSPLYNSMRKYGMDNFEIFLIKDNLSFEQSVKEEEKYIRKLNTLSPNGYNLNSGGEYFGKKCIFTDKHKENLIKNHADFSGEKNPNFKNISDNDKDYMKKLYKIDKFTCKEIGKIMNLTPKIVSKHLKLMGIKVKIKRSIYKNK